MKENHKWWCLDLQRPDPKLTVGKKFVVRSCPRCHRQTRSLIPKTPNPCPEPSPSGCLGVTHGEVPDASYIVEEEPHRLPPDAEFIRKGREQWGPIRKPWPEEKGAGQ